ncbi:hypothetical protein COY93_04645 [Candidatus Uhrbacteria bacterium CG_4_10_14_0_8_um_filter_58_22]|uniref:Uncharacterized protein n=1 Tax=Candidatus Uhrbacteria bacterium CG_4_10_14_0_8_um_filter_58_22 TaxID=1975029 RepID=A0A2M7Q9W1_9BACT|nr:MAG: hypothetical protein AUJ19_01805 [Parcubacteria group bacterium CG1_02_58_44]PIY61924.1 MAG: hypothetical protein COY93_04645 [Candidatus Uhrbacteria bacterium CG_4_10_14_0_8_um_filter_58_22]
MAVDEVDLARRKLDDAQRRANRALQSLTLRCLHSLCIHELGRVEAECDEDGHVVRVHPPARTCVFCRFREEQVVSEPLRRKLETEAMKRIAGEDGHVYIQADCGDLSRELNELPPFFKVLTRVPDGIARNGSEFMERKKELLAKAKAEVE